MEQTEGWCPGGVSREPQTWRGAAPCVWHGLLREGKDTVGVRGGRGRRVQALLWCQIGVPGPESANREQGSMWDGDPRHGTRYPPPGPLPLSQHRSLLTGGKAARGMETPTMGRALPLPGPSSTPPLTPPSRPLQASPRGPSGPLHGAGL